MIKNIYTIRHGEAEHQVNSDIWKTHKNNQIPLTELGRSQADECGRFIAETDIDFSKTVFVISPFARASQTALCIMKHIPHVVSCTDALVVEQDFGLFSGLSTEQCYKKYPKYAKLYDLHEKTKGKFYVVPPNGESKASVVERAEKFIEKISEKYQDTPIENIVIVSHCVFNRALNKALLNHSPEWLINEKQHDNCAVKHFVYQNGCWRDNGFVFVPTNKSLNNSVANAPSKKNIKTKKESRSVALNF